MNEQSRRELDWLRKRLAAARKRAAYWSGRPSAAGRGFVCRAGTHRDPDIEYEQALDDCHALADQIAELTGRRPTVTDYREQFRSRFCEGFSRLLNKDTNNDQTP